jgi:hypothetical protein
VGTRNDVRTVTVREPITLDDLRWLVDQTDGSDGTSRVEVHGPDDRNQRDVIPGSIVVKAFPVRRIPVPSAEGQ